MGRMSSWVLVSLVISSAFVGSLLAASPGGGAAPAAPAPAGDPGSGWIEDRLVSAGYAVDIAPARNGTLWAAVSYRGSALCGDGVDLYASTDSGYAWNYAATLNDCSAAPYHYWNASIAIDISIDKVYVAAERNDSTLWVLHGDPANGWAVVQLPGSGGFDTAPDIAVENDRGLNNRIYVASVWDVGFGANIALTFSENDGATWTWVDVASVGPPPRNQPAIAYANGQVWIAYRFVQDIYFGSVDVTAGPPFAITSDVAAATCNPDFCQWPDIAVLRDGSVGGIVYEYTAGADYDVYGVASGDGGVTWTPPIPVGQSAGDDVAPSFTVDYMTSGSNAVTGLFHLFYVRPAAVPAGVFYSTINPNTIAISPPVRVSDAARNPYGDVAYRTASTTQVRGLPGTWYPVVGMVGPGLADTAFATTPGWTTTFDSNPPGIGLTVTADGVISGLPATFSWPAESLRQLNVTSPQLEVAGTDRYLFVNWSTLDPQNFTYLAPAAGDAALTANFVHQWRVTVDTSPTGLQITVDSTLSTAPVTSWWNESSGHQLDVNFIQTVSADTRYAFVNWSDGATGLSKTVTVTDGTPYTANYKLQYRATVDTAPTGLDIRVDITTWTSPYQNWWDAGSQHDLTAPTPQPGWVFAEWADGVQTATRTVTATGPVNYTANYTAGAAMVLTATSDVTSGQAPLAVTFNGTAAGGNGNYVWKWDFGDGGTSSIEDPVHTFSTAGTFSVHVWLNDTGVNTTTATLSITVDPAPLFLEYCTVTPSPASVAVGGTQQFTAHGWTPSDVEIPAGDLSVSFTFSGTGGSVTTAGLFTATAVGTGTVTATVVLVESSDTCSAAVTVTAAVELAPFPLLPVLLLLLIVAVVLILLLVLWRRKKKRQEATPMAMAPGTAPMAPTQPTLPQQPMPATPPQPAPASGTVTERLAKLKELKDQGVLTDQEYEAKRKELLERL